MGSPITVFTARLPADEYVTLRLFAHAAGRSMNDVVNEAVRRFIVEHVDERLLADIEAAVREARATRERLRAT